MLSFVAGLICAVPLVFSKLFIIGIVSFALPAYIEYTARDAERGLWRTYGRGLSFFWGYGIVVFHWFSAMYPLDFAGLTKPAAVGVIIAGWFGLSLLQALVWGILFVILRFCAKYFSADKYPLAYSLIFSCLYVVFEWITTKTWAAVPWGRLAVGQTDFLPMIQISSVLGSYAVSFILVLFGCALGVCISEYRKSGEGRSFVSLILALVVLVANLSFGVVRSFVYETPDDSKKVTVAALQGNISSKDKWSDDSLYKTKKEYDALARAAASEGAEIIVLPETAIIYNVDGTYGGNIRNYYENVADITDSTLVTGAFTKNNDGISENSVIVISPDNGMSNEKYVKRHLVPFGEYVPMRKFISVVLPFLSEVSILADDLAHGTDAALLETKYGEIAPLICFDSIYETLAAESIREGGELITLSTNDSWFGDSAAVWLHNRHAVLRSVECGRYTVRSANTGVSSVISPKGEVMDFLPPLESGYIVCDVYMINENTVYTTIGNVFVPLCLIGGVLLMVYCGVKKKKEDTV